VADSSLPQQRRRATLGNSPSSTDQESAHRTQQLTCRASFVVDTAFRLTSNPTGGLGSGQLEMV
jgi:hypothetical protein